MKNKLTLFLLFATLTVSNAQVLNTIKYSTANSGLPNDQVMGLDITSNDVLWISTFGNGLVSFDGTNWVKYDATTPNFPGDYVKDVIVDKNNNVFAIGGFMVSKFNNNSWSDISTNNGIPKAFTKDANGNIWLGDNDLQKYNGTSWDTPVTIPSNVKYEPIKMVGDTNNNIWITNGSGPSVTKYNPSLSTWVIYDTSNVSLFKQQSTISTIKTTHDNKIVAQGSWNTLYFDGTKWGKLDSLAGLVLMELNDVAIRNNVSWLGMGNGFGLASYNGLSWKKYSTNPSNLLLSGMRFDSKGNLWIGAGDGLYKINSTNLAINNINELTEVALLYPNPSKGVMNLKLLAGNPGNAVANIFSANGSIAYTLELNSGDNTLDLTHLSEGVYILNMITSRGSYFQKIILH